MMAYVSLYPSGVELGMNAHCDSLSAGIVVILMSADGSESTEGLYFVNSKNQEKVSAGLKQYGGVVVLPTHPHGVTICKRSDARLVVSFIFEYY